MLVYVVAVFVSFLAGLLAMARFSMPRCPLALSMTSYRDGFALRSTNATHCPWFVNCGKACQPPFLH